MQFLRPKFYKTLFLSLVSCLALAGASGVVHAVTVVVPNSLAGVEGNSNNGFPFNIATFGLSSQRYQQVYDASQFAALAAGGELITQIAFRPDVTFGAVFSSTLPSIRIDLSTTSLSPDGLSATFASNVGADNTIVYGGASGAPLSLSSAFTGPVAGPKDFDILINLTTPFLYNPANGNLLLDVRNFGGGATTQFDAENTIGDSVSRATTNISGGVNSSTANLTDSFGLVTRFTTAPVQAEVPEPTTVTLLGIGLAGLIIAYRRSKQ